MSIVDKLEHLFLSSKEKYGNFVYLSEKMYVNNFEDNLPDSNKKYVFISNKIGATEYSTATEIKLSKNLNSDEIIVSETIARNINLCLHEQQSEINIHIPIAPLESRIASSVELNRINGLPYPPSEIEQAAFNSFFDIPKVISAGSILEIPFYWAPSSIGISYLYSDNSSIRKLYYFVKTAEFSNDPIIVSFSHRLKPCIDLVSKDSTKLLIKDHINLRVPYKNNVIDGVQHPFKFKITNHPKMITSDSSLTFAFRLENSIQCILPNEFLNHIFPVYSNLLVNSNFVNIPIATESFSGYDIVTQINYAADYMGINVFYIDIKALFGGLNSPKFNNSDSDFKKLSDEFKIVYPCLICFQGIEKYLEHIKYMMGADSLEKLDQDHIKYITDNITRFLNFLSSSSTENSKNNSFYDLYDTVSLRLCNIVFFTLMVFDYASLPVQIQRLFPDLFKLSSSKNYSSNFVSEIFNIEKSHSGGYYKTSFGSINVHEVIKKKNLHIEEIKEIKNSILLRTFQRKYIDRSEDEGDYQEFTYESQIENILDNTLEILSNENIISQPESFRKNPTLKTEPAFSLPDQDLIVEESHVTQTLETFSSFLPSSPAYSKRINKNKTNSQTFETNVNPVFWDEIGGLFDVRKEILDIFLLPFRISSSFSSKVPSRRSILLYGPPGTGKTMIARAVATECKMNFISVKGPELLDVYVGESEKNVRDLFSYAKCNSPCVIFFDELDSLAPARGKGQSGGGVMDRVVSQLLAEMDEMNEKSDDRISNEQESIFVIGATNRPDLLEPALLRFGRFDRKIFVGFSEDIPSKLSILKAQTKKFAFQGDFNLEEIALLLPKSVSGADISALCRSAYLIALDRTLVQFKEQALNHHINSSSKLESSISEEEMNEITALYMDSLPQNDLIVKVKYPDFTSAIQNFTPSLSEAELNEYKAMNTSIDNDNIASYGEKLIHSDVNSQIEILM